MKTIHLDNDGVFAIAKKAAETIWQATGKASVNLFATEKDALPFVYIIAKHLDGAEVVDHPSKSDVLVTLRHDWQGTMEFWCDKYPGKPYIYAADTTEGKPQFTFPWESLNAPESLVRNMLQVIGEDPNREGLLETPNRVVKAWNTWFGGYNQDPASVLKVFEDGAEGCDEAVIVRDIDVYSHCEHHMAPIFGKCTIAYIPDKKIVGLSKLNRLVDIFARRLQVQERLTTQIADALQTHLSPKGIFVQIDARHLCVESRGVKQNSATTTTALRGLFREDAAARAEILATIRK